MPVLAQLEGLAAGLVNPSLLVAGAAATALPILIHFLNRRRFRVVEWAAMEFLLEAEQQNRRRLRLENMLLLALRCLAVFLIGVVLARPLLPTGAAPGFVGAGRFEPLVLLDDSLSMQALVGNESAWEAAIRQLTDWAATLAQERAGHSLTVVLASQPEVPVLDQVPLTVDTVGEVRERLAKLTCSDGQIDLQAAIERWADRLESERPDSSRIVSVVSDLRAVDWSGNALVQPLKRLAGLAQGCFVIDAAADDPQNLSIVDLRTEGVLVAGVPTGLDVSVKNQGTSVATDVRVTMTPEGGLPVEMRVPALPPQDTAMVLFPLMLGETTDAEEEAQRQPLARKVTVELARAAGGTPDRLAGDDVAYFPARLMGRIPVLVVDGDPSKRDGEGESFFLQRALAPEGPIASGVKTTVVSAVDAGGVEFGDYQVVFLTNADRLGDAPADAAERLRQWVAQGGGLVLMPGDRVDAGTYNSLYGNEGAGLSPVSLATVRGDDSQAVWATILIDDVPSGSLAQFADRDSSLLRGVKVFRWWQGSAAAAAESGENSVLAWLNDDARSPFAASQAVGHGRVIVITVPADDAWHNWPSDPSFLLFMQDVVRSLVDRRDHRGWLQVGEPIVERSDIGKYETEAELRDPDGTTTRLTAAAPDVSREGEGTEWRFVGPRATKLGFYELLLAKRDGSPEIRLFGVNAPPAEGDLRRVDPRILDELLGEAKVRLVKAGELKSLAATGERNEVARYLLLVVAFVLAGEQALGWWLGRRRT